MSREISKNVMAILSQRDFDTYIEKKSTMGTPLREKPYASKLNIMGRKAYFDEYFYEIKLEDQDIPQIMGPDVDVRETLSFKQGYDRGKFLVEHDNVPEEYKNLNNKHR